MVLWYILEYLIAHPDAKDTLRGILRWWLPGPPHTWEEGEVQKTLEGLVAKGWLTQRQTTASQILYGLNQQKRAEILAFLRTPACDIDRSP
jgi:hypothetical protein